VPILNQVRRLDRVNWNFPGAGTAPGSVHSIHWFPGNFIPQIPAVSIQLLSEPGDLVLDPFGGSGTTGVEAARLGRRSIISDRMSACVLISAAKLAMLSGALDRRMRIKLLEQLTFDHECRSDHIGRGGEGGNSELHAWYASDTLAQLRYIWALVEDQASKANRMVLTALFSDVLFDCAAPGGALTRTGGRRRHHWGWVADNVHPRVLAEHDAIDRFRRRLMMNDLPHSEGPVGLVMPATSGSSAGLVVQQDARKMALPDGVVDLIVTSPPYVGVIDYTHANRLLYNWMGWSMADERRDEIGARFRRKRKRLVDEYVTDMRRSRDEMYRVLRPGAFIAMVLGESKSFPGTTQRVFADFGELMPQVWGPVRRNPSRRRVSDRAARDPVEFVCVFRKL
jgi:hypothetical protein